MYIPPRIGHESFQIERRYCHELIGHAALLASQRIEASEAPTRGQGTRSTYAWKEEGMYINNADCPRRGVTFSEPHPVLFGLKENDERKVPLE